MVKAEKENYDVVLAGLIRDRDELQDDLDQLDNAIILIERKKVALEKTGKALTKLSSTLPQIKIGESEFQHLDMIDAAVAFLDKVGTPQETAIVTDALLEGGIKTTAKDKRASIGNTLRGSKDKRLVRKGRLWSLSKWK